MATRLQNRIAESAATLPAAAVAATLLWWLPHGAYTTTYLLGWAAAALTAAILAATDHHNRLIRLRSTQLTPALYLIIIAAAGDLHPIQPATAAAPLVAAAIYCLLRTNGQTRPQLHTFHAHLLIALAALLCAPQLLLLAPILLACQALYLRTLSAPALRAAVIGLALPYALAATATFALRAYEAVGQNADHTPTTHLLHATPAATNPLHALWPAANPSDAEPTQAEAQTNDALNALNALNALTPWIGTLIDDARSLTPQAFVQQLLRRAAPHRTLLATLACTLLIALTGNVHYLRQSLDDNTRVRMSHYTLITLHAALLIWTLLLPQQLPLLLPLLILTAAPTAAHFIALTHTHATNAWTLCLAAAIAALAAYTLR